MNQALGKQQHAAKKFFVVINFLIALVWLQVFSRMAVRLWAGNILFFWNEFIFDFLFSALFTALLLLLNKKLHRHLADREADHVKLFRQNPHPMWIYDLKTLQFLAVNDAALILYGYSEQEFLEMTIKDIRPAEDVPSLITETEKIKLNFNQDYHWSGTWRHKLKNGQRSYVEVSSHEVLYEGKKAQLVLAYNVTEKILQDQKLQALNQELESKVMSRTNDLLQLNKRLVDQNKTIKSANLELFTVTTQLQEANEKIREHADLKHKFVSMASHEFRTPLANISFSAGFIRRNLNKVNAENVLGKIQAIETQVTHMVSLLDDVLTIGKADAVKLEVTIREVNIENFISKIIQEVHAANNDSHRIHLNMLEDVQPVIHTDEKFLRNIFINLLNNAIKYSPSGHDVHLNIHAVHNDICFDVIDKGLGLRSEDLDKIFEPFYRSSNAQNIKGTGLGLSIVKRAADLLNAKVKVSSKVGEGSTFSVFLPVM